MECFQLRAAGTRLTHIAELHCALRDNLRVAIDFLSVASEIIQKLVEYRWNASILVAQGQPHARTDSAVVGLTMEAAELKSASL